MKKVRVNLMIYGDVTGVGYRYFVRMNAKELGLLGFVRNVKKGLVEAVFEGEKEKAELMVEVCKKGPEVAWVEKVDTDWNDATNEFTQFEIRQ